MANRQMRFTKSNIKYLLALHKLNQKPGGIRCVDVADSLHITKPSVHTMINTLKNMQLVNKDKYGVVRFTPLGEKTAEQYNEYFQTICNYFTAILPDSANIQNAAYVLLSEIPCQTLEEMCENIKKKNYTTSTQNVAWQYHNIT